MRILVSLALVLGLSSLVAAKALFLTNQDQTNPGHRARQNISSGTIKETLSVARDSCYQLIQNLGLIKESSEIIETPALHSDQMAKIDSGKSEVSKLMLSLEDEIKAMDKELESINNDLSGIQNKLVISQSNMDHAVEEAGIEASKADQATLDKYASGIVDVAITEMKNNVPYEKDIFTHSKELNREVEVTANTEVISL